MLWQYEYIECNLTIFQAKSRNIKLLTFSIGSPDCHIDNQITNNKNSPREVTQLGTEHN